MAGFIIDKTGGYKTAIIAAMGMAFFAFLLLIPVERYIHDKSRIRPRNFGKYIGFLSRLRGKNVENIINELRGDPDD